jgi:4-amino-4-deoxy-L-arabinose transferase
MNGPGIPRLSHRSASLADTTTERWIERWGVAVLLLAFLVCYLLPLTLHGLWIPDETRYAQISQEMLGTGHWAAPHFMGFRYFEKPAAGYWWIAASQALFGQNLFGVRFASAMSTGLSVMLAYRLAHHLWHDPRKSFACALLYMSFGLIAGQAGYANLDPQFTFWVNLSLVLMVLALDATTPGRRHLAWAMVGAACGAGFMTKGFLAFVLPVLVALPFMLWQRRLGEMVRAGALAIVVAALVSLPWVLAVHGQEADFWNFFFWNEHVRRFAAEDAQHARPWWFYLPLLAASCLPWAGMLVPAFRTAWSDKATPATGLLLIWLILPLVFFSFSRGKLPTYIMPCLLPLALLMGNGLMDRLAQGDGRAIRGNGLLNLIIAGSALAGLAYLQISRPVFERQDLFALTLAYVVLLGWIICNALQVMRPLKFWAAPALGLWLLVALLPSAMPASVVASKMPDQFIAQHLSELAQSDRLLSNDLGAASALAWRLNRPDVALYNTVGELKYGISYHDARWREVGLDNVQQWMADARRQGSVGVVMRVNSTEEVHEVELLPIDGKRYEQGGLTILTFPQLQP